MNVTVKKGIVLLIAVLFASIALSVGLGLSSIFLREIRIARTLEPSLRAFYAVDSGVECALFENYLNDSFNTDSPASFVTSCANASIPVTWNSGLEQYEFEVPYVYDGKQACASIQVKKQVIGPRECTRFDTSGRSDACGVITNKTVERGLRIYDPRTCRF